MMGGLKVCDLQTGRSSMLSLMRKHAGTWLIKFILGAIVVVFVFWGVGSYTSQRSNRVATVNGEAVTLEDYRAGYNQLLDQMRQSFGNNLTEDLIQKLGLQQRALDQIVERMLMRQAAAEMGLQVTDEELAESISRVPAFQTAGAFDSRRYSNLLSLNRLTPEAFEMNQRNSLLVQKLQRLITEGVKVSDAEAEDWYRWEKASVAIDYAVFDPASYQQITAPEEEIQDYFDAHQENYKTQPRRKIQYLRFSAADYLDQVVVRDEEVADYYASHRSEFTSPKTVEARHILLKVEADATEEVDRSVRERIEEILKQARGGKDFAKLAQEYSEGPTAANGGYLGKFQRDSMVKPFADTAFSMKAGEISDPVRTQFGWHIIKVESIQEASTRSLDEARAEIKDKIASERAKIRALEAAEQAYDVAYDYEDLASVASETGAQLHTTGFIARGEQVEGVKDSAGFVENAFNLPLNVSSEMLDLADGYYILQPVEIREAAVPELDAVKSDVRADLIRQKQDQAAQKDARALLAELQNGKSLQEALSGFDVEFKRSDFFQRNQPIPEVADSTAVSRAAFSLSDQDPLPAEPLRTNSGYWVFRFAEKRLPDMEAFETEKENIRSRLLQQKRFKLFDAWLKQRREQSEVAIEEGFLSKV
jgi:peptidyl-prolyl cis-trans isomerase D